MTMPTLVAGMGRKHKKRQNGKFALRPNFPAYTAKPEPFRVLAIASGIKRAPSLRQKFLTIVPASRQVLRSPEQGSITKPLKLLNKTII
jgi:hypothetical protein